MKTPSTFCACVLRTSAAVLALLFFLAGFANNLHAEGEREGYVWRGKDGKTMISNLPRDESGAPTRDPTDSSTEDAAPAPAKGFYQWTDTDGVVHLTDRFEKIPVERRDTAVQQPFPEPDFFDIELSPAVRALLRQAPIEHLPRKWFAIGGIAFGALLGSFVFWRRHRTLRPGLDPLVGRTTDGGASAASDDGTLGAGETLDAEAKLVECYKLIGVDPNALSSEVRKAYYQRIGEYHPDKVASLGAELRALAEAKSREINAAYEAILFYRGEA